MTIVPGSLAASGVAVNVAFLEDSGVPVAAFTVSRATEADALATWEHSGHASVFTHPEVLDALAGDVEWWKIEKGAEIWAVWPVPLDSQRDPTGVPFAYFVGPLWTSDAYGFPAHRSLSATKEVYQGFIEELLPHYGSLRASLPPGQDDVRWFDWWNYGESPESRFRITPRYSARIENLQALTDADLMAGLRQLRRRELRKIEKQGAPPRVEDLKAKEVVDLYVSAFERQGEAVSGDTLTRINQLVDLVHAGFGTIVGFRTEDGSPAAAILLLEAAGQANMVLNLVHEDWRGTGLAAMAVLEAIRDARGYGQRSFDFNGANSPNRGDDKHSYGAKPVLYFDVAYG